MLRAAVLNCIDCRNVQSGCSGGGRSEVLASSPHPQRHRRRHLSWRSLQGLVGKCPGQQVRLCMPFGFIYLHSVGLLVQKLLTTCVWEHMLASPSRCIWRTGLSHLRLELLACISVMFGCFLLTILALSILVSSTYLEYLFYCCNNAL